MLTLKSSDGTQIAYDKYGSGPAVVLVDGAFCTRSFGPMPKVAPLLADKFTVYAYDRRARGDSGDTKPYAIQREIDDLKAVIDVAGGAAHVLGMSSGAMLCLLAAAQNIGIGKLVVYEPPYVVEQKFARQAGDHVATLDKLVAAGQHSKAATYYFTRMIGLPAIVPFIMKLTPLWGKLKATAPALPYDARIVADFSLPTALLNTIRMPVLAIGGGRSGAMLQGAVKAVAAAVPGAQWALLPGQTHNVDVKVLAPVLTHFYNNA